MRQKVRSAEYVKRPTPRSVLRTGGASGVNTRATLEALAEATDRYDGVPGLGGPPVRRISYFLAVAAAMLAGTAVMFAGRFERICTVTMRITGDASPARCAVYRSELVRFLSQRMTDAGTDGAGRGGWFVDSPEPDRLRLGLRSFDRRAGVALARSVAEEYQSEMRATTAQARRTPGEAERIISDYAAELRSRLGTTLARVDAAMADLSEVELPTERDALMARWRKLRTEFDAARDRLSEATSEVARLLAAPEPTHGLVSAEQRRGALANDAALQQDLRELGVNLTELKLHLLEVWQQSSGPLERLALAAGDLVEILPAYRGQERAGAGAADARTLAAAAEGYRQMLLDFAEVWNREFTAVQRCKVDPRRGDILDIYEHVRRRLNDYLFQAGRRFSAMRSQLHALAADRTNTARHHVFQSNLVRAFQAAQVAHHRFEFAAGLIETPDNFRLDAALRAAHGLRRRSQERMRGIERRLQAEAAERAGEHRLQKLDEAKRLVESLRGVTDEHMSGLLALQDELNLSAECKENFLRGVLKFEIAAVRAEQLQDDLTGAESRLRRLVSERTSAVQGVDIKIVSCDVQGTPLHLAGHLRNGGAAAVVTLLGVLLGQWWITRRW